MNKEKKQEEKEGRERGGGKKREGEGRREKGGEGRSFVCRALIDYHRDRKIPFSGFDTCRSYSDVSRFYTNIEGCEVKGFSYEDSLPDIATTVLKKEIEGNVIVNLQTHGMALMMRPWIDVDKDARLSELQSKNAVIWFVSIGSCDSHRLLEESLRYFQGSVPHILVKNLSGRSYWNIDSVNERFEQISTKYNLPVITFPNFPESKALRAILNEDIPYLEAQYHPDLSIVCKRRSSVFLNRAFAALELAEAI